MLGYLFIGLGLAWTLFGDDETSSSSGGGGESSEGDVEALARAIASEVSTHTAAERRAVAWAIKNGALHRGRSIYVMGGAGSWGRQGEEGAQGKRAFSTAQDPSARDLELAREVLGGGAPDPLGGAWEFFEPMLQDTLAARGQAYRDNPSAHPEWARWNLYKSDAEALRGRWSNAGLSYATTVGRWEFWS